MTAVKLIAAVVCALISIVVLAAAIPLRFSAAVKLWAHGMDICFVLGLFCGAVNIRLYRRIRLSGDGVPIVSKGRRKAEWTPLIRKRKKRKKTSSPLDRLIRSCFAPGRSCLRVKLLGASGSIGSIYSADKAVAAAGLIRTAFLTAFALLPNAERDCFIRPEFGRDVFEIDILCIASFDTGKFILRELNAKRSKQHGTSY